MKKAYPNKTRMANPYFQFKQFKIFQDNCAMKVGTDGVLLGAWTPVKGAQTILDVGSGTGLIALMLAQRTCEAAITGVEINHDACMQARENVRQSPWSGRIEMLEEDFRQFSQLAKHQYDLIVSNPPYFVDSKGSPVEARRVARHTSQLSYTDLIEGVLHLLRPEGHFSLILPAQNHRLFSQVALERGLFETKRLEIFPTPQKLVSRILSFWDLRGQSALEEEKMVLEVNGRHHYSDAYWSLTRDFYLARFISNKKT